MADRRSTPDILGDLLGGSPPSSSQLKLQDSDRSKMPAKQSKGIPEIPRDADSGEIDTNYFETLLEHAASALVLVAEVLGHQKLVDWLEEMREVFATDETVTTRKAPAEAFKQNAASWAKKHLGAKNTTVCYLANGAMVSSPFEVDVWAQFKGEGAQSDLDVWIECRDSEEPVKKKDIMKLVQKATDVFHAAHTEKQDFWFDRMMLISNAAFDPGAMDLAEQIGIACVSYDGTSYSFKTKGNWKLKPNWLRDAEASEGITWHSPITKDTSHAASGN